MSFVWVACGGAMGAMARYGTTLMAARWLGPKYPWGTFAANMLGCFLMGIAFELSRHKIALHNEQAKLLLMVGFLGAFTTFSSFALDSVLLHKQQSIHIMFVNVGVQNILGIALVLTGMWAIQTFF